MSNDVVKIDSNTIMTNVKERIRNAYVQMIPDDAWESLVKVEIDEFFKVKYQDNYNYQKPIHSPFRIIVQKVLKERISKLLKEYINATYESHNINNGIPEPTQFIKDIISQNSEKIMTDLLAGMLQKSINSNF